MSCSQQDAVYRAEKSLPRGREFSTPAQVEDLFERVREEWSRWEHDFKNVLFVDVFVHDRGRSRAKAEGDGGVVNLNCGQLCEMVALHELAHVLANSRYGKAGHSPWYARIMLELVSVVMGADAYLALYEAYAREGVDHHTDDAGGRSICL